MTNNSEIKLGSCARISQDDIKQAFALSLFHLVYQPKISLNEPRCLLGAEVFVRMDHPKFGSISPELFLPTILQMNMMLELTLLVVRQAIKHWESLSLAGYKVQLSINIDHHLLEERALAAKLSEEVSRSKIEKRYFIFEISNSQSPEITATLREQIMRMRMKGFRIAMDNCGRSKLDESQIFTLPLDELKLHRLLVADLLVSSEARQQARHIQNIANRIGVPMVGVGVESPEQADWLRRLGCECAQGFLYGPPIPVESFEIFLVDLNQWQMPAINKELHVLIVHSNPDFSLALSEVLNEKYQVTVAQSVLDANQVIAESSPEILVVAQALEDGSGIELCRTLHDKNAERYSVLIVADDDNGELRIEAYSAGAADCLDKNIKVDEIFAKIERLANYHIKRQSMHEQHLEMQKAAIGSMMEAAHYGDVLQFVKKLISCRDELAMAKLVFTFMESKNLDCAIQFRGTDILQSFNSDGAFCSPLELNMFEMMSNKGRLFAFKNRTIANDQHVSILIKNMPSDEEEVGRIRDYIAVVIESLEARYQDTLRKRTLYSVFDQLTTMAGNLSEEIFADQQHKKQIIEQLNIDLQMSFHLLDLNEDQEIHITKIVDSLLNGYEESEDTAIATRERVNEITKLLSRSIADLEPPQTSDTVVSSSDIEFF